MPALVATYTVVNWLQRVGSPIEHETGRSSMLVFASQGGMRRAICERRARSAGSHSELDL